MQRVATTVLAVVGADASRHAEGLGRAANVRLLAPDPDQPPLARATASLREAAGTAAPYAVTDADPLATVADAWVRFFDEQGPRGELEVAVTDTLARWRAHTLELPDYYLVTGAAALSATRRHWFLGFLHHHASHRVQPLPADDGAVAGAVRGLRAGPWWPPLDRLLEGVDRATPDALAPRTVSAEATGPPVVRSGHPGASAPTDGRSSTRRSS